MKFQTENLAELWIDEGIFVRELMNYSGYPDMSVARCRLPAGKTTQRHRLSVEEIYIIEQGRGLMCVADQQTHVVAGDAVPVPTGAVQNIQNIGDNDLIFLVICRPRFTDSCYTAVE